MHVRPDQNWESLVANHPEYISYQLFIEVKKPQNIQIGRLGRFHFPAGRYVYTGSARRNLVARVRRHLLKNKANRWHIDYLLGVNDVQVVELNFSDQSECRLNQRCGDEVLSPGFGASDCKHNCGSHLKYLGDTN